MHWTVSVWRRGRVALSGGGSRRCACVELGKGREERRERGRGGGREGGREGGKGQLRWLCKMMTREEQEQEQEEGEKKEEEDQEVEEKEEGQEEERRGTTRCPGRSLHIARSRRRGVWGGEGGERRSDEDEDLHRRRQSDQGRSGPCRR